jgi:hypothetical protein
MGRMCSMFRDFTEPMKSHFFKGRGTLLSELKECNQALKSDEGKSF